MAFPSQLLLLSRNFGSFAAVREGLRAARGRWLAVMSADLQEDATVVPAFLDALRADEADVVLGVRESRADPWAERVAAGVFWGLYRAFIRRDLPPGGVDVFGCNAAFRDHLVRLGESYSSLVGQILWLGFRRKLVPTPPRRAPQGPKRMDPSPQGRLPARQRLLVFRSSGEGLRGARRDRHRGEHRARPRPS